MTISPFFGAIINAAVLSDQSAILKPCGRMKDFDCGGVILANALMGFAAPVSFHTGEPHMIGRWDGTVA